MTIKAVTNAVPAVFVPISKLWQHLPGNAVGFVRPHARLKRYVLAAGVDYYLIKTAQMSYAILYATLSLLGG